MNDKFKQLNGKLNSSNKNFSPYNGNSNLTEAMKIANEFHKEKTKNFRETINLKKPELVPNSDSNVDISGKDSLDEKHENEKQNKHPTFELSDDEIKRRVELSKKRNSLALNELNENSSIDELLSGIIDDLTNN